MASLSKDMASIMLEIKKEMDLGTELEALAIDSKTQASSL
jgi:hypothetical protein